MPYRHDSEARCPHCRDVALSLQTIQWIERRSCSGCRGVWFDLADLAELGQDLRLKLELPCGELQFIETPRRCPRCPKDMVLELVAHRGNAVPIDVCHTCGVWFDKEELEPFLEILMAVADAGRSPFARTNRPWWAATLSFLVDSLGAGGSKKVGW